MSGLRPLKPYVSTSGRTEGMTTTRHAGWWRHSSSRCTCLDLGWACEPRGVTPGINHGGRAVERERSGLNRFCRLLT